ncbi:KxYKxGKxW signal peptide domain-containing protein [Weissella sp. LMG 11983]|uniref:KxYKxGKxW signal peptide domain-containing protein n=1 Tax=Weissella sp. LMG 11983 TaxID=2987700 RepID=UPI0021F8DD87|nr:KxYKxGKxW signal peptide domain-containing protein [Weissella sp. LMG 11983]MCW0926478.1 KxYKxGKxW signal peptide domain-containing protein [Weissella sp. LMG 11983]
MQNVNSRKKMYKSGKNWVAATVVAAAAAIVPMVSTESAYANEEVAQTTSAWRAKTVSSGRSRSSRRSKVHGSSW